MARRSDMAVVRSLRDDRRCTVAARTPILHEDEGFQKDAGRHPSLSRRPRHERSCTALGPLRPHCRPSRAS